MNKPLTYTRLLTLPFFAHLTEHQWNDLVSQTRYITISSGQPVTGHFVTTDGFWFLLDGSWRVERKVAGNAELMFENDRVGTWTGGIPVIDAIAPVKATATSNSEFMWVSIEGMNQLVSNNTHIASKLLEAVNWGSDFIGNILLSAKP